MNSPMPADSPNMVPEIVFVGIGLVEEILDAVQIHGWEVLCKRFHISIFSKFLMHFE